MNDILIQKAELATYNFLVKFGPFLENYMAEKTDSLESIHEYGETVGNIISVFICPEDPGKRVRPALTYFGYLAAGGTDDEKIMYASAGSEILHNFFLVHDDIIDQSDYRRKEPTVHKKFESKYCKKDILPYLPKSKYEFFSSSLAIIAGDICCALAYEALIDSGFEDKKILMGLRMMHEIVKITAIGETIDVIKPYEKNATEEEVMQIHLLKTAKYTVECPILLGAILHGASDEIINGLKQYAIPVGIAFQIKDDILGILGDPKKTKKPVGSDIIERKQTLLTVKVLENGSQEDKKILLDLMGKTKIQESEIKQIENIIRKTGALQYSEDKIAELTYQGIEALQNLPINKEVSEILTGIALRLMQRDY